MSSRAAIRVQCEWQKKRFESQKNRRVYTKSDLNWSKHNDFKALAVERRRSIQPCGRGKRRRTCDPHLITGNTDKVEGGLPELLVKMMDDMAQESGKRVGLPDQPQKRPAQDTLDDGVACSQ